GAGREGALAVAGQTACCAQPVGIECGGVTKAVDPMSARDYTRARQVRGVPVDGGEGHRDADSDRSRPAGRCEPALLAGWQGGCDARRRFEYGAVEGRPPMTIREASASGISGIAMIHG